jgi:hypothetical protein
MCTQYVDHIHSPILFPYHLPLPTGTNIPPPAPRRTCSILLFSDFVEEKKWQFCLFKIATQGAVFPCDISMSIYVLYLKWVYFSSFDLSCFLMVVSTGLKILVSFLYREYINHIHLLNFLLFPYPSHVWPTFSVTCFS